MIDLSGISSTIHHLDGPIWSCGSRSAGISYPAEGHDSCFEIEADSFWFMHRNRIILSSLKTYPPSGVFFDIGGGNGFTSRELTGAGYETVMVEPGITGVRNAEKRGVTHIIWSTLEEVGFNNGTLGAAGLFDVLEHVEADDVFLERLRVLLSEKGKLYITVPAYRQLWSRYDEYAGHKRRYTLRGLRSLLVHCGFTPLYSTCFFALLPVPIYLFRSLPSRLGLYKAGPQADKVHTTNILIGKVISTILNIETRIVLGQGRIPFGASCLIVAEKT